MDPYCPFCGSVWTRRSHRRLLERLLSLLGRYPFRCMECHGRFFMPWRKAVHSPREWVFVQPAFPPRASAAAAPPSRDLARLHRELQSAAPHVPAEPVAPGEPASSPKSIQTNPSHSLWG